MVPQFLELLRCPESGQRLSLAPAEVLAGLEALRCEGVLSVPAAAPQWDPALPLDAVLVREDGRVGYPVQGGIPILLPGHGFALGK
ncbi:MAG: hypothetical protein ACFUZC_23285 [Chthoniobacteraceae bacterium]